MTLADIFASCTLHFIESSFNLYNNSVSCKLSQLQLKALNELWKSLLDSHPYINQRFKKNMAPCLVNSANNSEQTSHFFLSDALNCRSNRKWKRVSQQIVGGHSPVDIL